MATDKKISELADADALTGTELVEAVQGGVNKKTTTQQIADLGGGGGAVDSVNGQTGVVVLDAGDIGVTPTGGIAATDVQAALAELDSEKLSSVPDSSETVKGIIEIATQAETNTGTDDVRAVTPLKLATVLDTDFFYVSSFRSLYNY